MNDRKIAANATLRQRRDRQLVQRILAGDEAALRGFMREYFPRLYRYTRHRLRNASDVEDVVQVTLTQAARRLETYRGEATLLTWLIQICRHEIARQCRQNQREADLMAPFLDDDVLRSVVESVATDSTPESDNRRIQVIGLVQFTLDQLPEHYAAALELKYIEGCNSKEIAQRLRISDEATQSLLARARRAFREVCGVALRTAM